MHKKHAGAVKTVLCIVISGHHRVGCKIVKIAISKIWWGKFASQ